MPVNVMNGGTASAVPGGHFTMFRERNADALFNSKMSREDQTAKNMDSMMNSNMQASHEVNGLN